MYYPPETGAPQRRLSELARCFQKSGHHVMVYTAFPTYPDGILKQKYPSCFYHRETLDEIEVIRSYIWFSPCMTMYSRLLTQISFMVSSFFSILYSEKNDVILVESPPLFLGITAVLLKLLTGSRVFFHVADLWPDSIRELGAVKNTLILDILYLIEKTVYRCSDMVVCVTRGIFRSLKKRGFRRLAFIPNGADFNKISFREEKSLEMMSRFGFSSEDFIVLYAGTFGMSHPLEEILSAASELTDLKVKFLFTGNGVRFSEISVLSESYQNVQVSEAFPCEKMTDLLSIADLTVLALKDLPLFKGALPSKIYEANAAGKPVFALCSGETEEYFRKSGGGEALGFGNSRLLAERIRYYYHHRTELKKMGISGMNHIRKLYSRERLGKIYLKLFMKQ